MLNLFEMLRQGGNVALAAILLLVLRLPIVCLSLSFHESAHGFMANKLGDPTAKSLGRISLDPFKHFDIMGTLSLLILGIGWAKPVPVNSRYFKKPKRDMALTAIAGPVSNIILAIVGIIILRVIDITAFGGQYMVTGGGVFENYRYSGSLSDNCLGFIMEPGVSAGGRILFIVMLFFELLALMNVSLALFNLIPIPPFDGSRLAFVFLPDRLYWGLMKYEQIIMFVFIILFYTFGSGFSFLANGAFEGLYKLITLATPFV